MFFNSLDAEAETEVTDTQGGAEANTESDVQGERTFGEIVAGDASVSAATFDINRIDEDDEDQLRKWMSAPSEGDDGEIDAVPEDGDAQQQQSPARDVEIEMEMASVTSAASGECDVMQEQELDPEVGQPEGGDSNGGFQSAEEEESCPVLEAD